MSYQKNFGQKIRVCQKSILILETSYADIAVSYAQVLDDEVSDANSIEKIVRRIESLPSGGLVDLTFKSRIDDTLQPLLVKVPDGYTKSKSWPLLVVLHGLGDGPIIVPQINSIVQIGPFGRGDLWYRDLGERDVFECIELVRAVQGQRGDSIFDLNLDDVAHGSLQADDGSADLDFVRFDRQSAFARSGDGSVGVAGR